MSSLLKKYWKAALSFLFACAVCIFWWAFHPAHLAYQEQLQLFLFDGAYFTERLASPGGLANYVAEFLTQFFYYPWLGAVLLALLFLALQRLTWCLARMQGAADVYYPFSFLPALLLWRFLGDENGMLALPVSLLLALLVAWIYSACWKSRLRMVWVILSLAVLYWVAGAVHFVFMGWVMLCEIRRGVQEGRSLWGVFLSVIVFLVALFCPLLASLWVPFPLYRLMCGLDYYRFPMIVPALQIVAPVFFAVLPFVLGVLPSVRKRMSAWALGFILLMAVGGAWLVLGGFNAKRERAITYDYLVRTERLHDLIRLAEQESPDSPFEVACLNLSLAMTGQLGDRMFQFYQNGTEGLLPQFQRDFTSPLPAAEAYYHLGMINTAQRYVFEAMEAIPNFNKSGRSFKRLAETNLINGQYEVAAKYLRILSRTLFYSDWAEETMTYLGNEDKINSHPEWGRLRRLRYTEDFLFSDSEMDMMLGLLYQHNHANRMAFEYLLAYVLQQRNLEKFMKYYPLGKDAGYDHIPRSYQEALIYVWTQNNRNFNNLPWSISPSVLNAVTEFARVYMTQQNSQPILQARYGDTYWYYLLFGGQPAAGAGR